MKLLLSILLGVGAGAGARSPRAVPDALLPDQAEHGVCFTTEGSDARRYCVPVGTRLVMFGDSTMRYSYLALVFALAHGREHTHDWPNRSIVNERSFARDAGVPNGNWRPFYESTNSMLRPGIEHCDCYRGSTCCSSPMSENRYFFHRNVSITYIQSGPGGARVPTYGAWWPGQPDSSRSPHLRSPSPPYNTNTSKFWRLWFPELVTTLLPLLEPTEVILHQSVAPQSRRAPYEPPISLPRCCTNQSALTHSTLCHCSVSKLQALLSQVRPTPRRILWKTELARVNATTTSKYVHDVAAHNARQPLLAAAAAAEAAKYFDVLDAYGLSMHLGATDRWDTLGVGCRKGCHGMHLTSRPNNEINRAMLRMLWEQPSHVRASS